MELTVLERILIGNLLPKEGDFLTIRILRDLRRDLSFSEAEHSKLKFDHGENGTIRWQPEGDIPKDIPIGDVATTLIRTALISLDADKKLTEDHITIYEKFVGV